MVAKGARRTLFFQCRRRCRPAGEPHDQVVQPAAGGRRCHALERQFPARLQPARQADCSQRQAQGSPVNCASRDANHLQQHKLANAYVGVLHHINTKVLHRHVAKHLKHS